MLQMARQLTDGVDGILLDKRYIILDRDTKYCRTFRYFLKRKGIEVIRAPAAISQSECARGKMGARGPR
jgi:putative transposase